MFSSYFSATFILKWSGDVTGLRRAPCLLWFGRGKVCLNHYNLKCTDDEHYCFLMSKAHREERCVSFHSVCREWCEFSDWNWSFLNESWTKRFIDSDPLVKTVARLRWAQSAQITARCTCECVSDGEMKLRIVKRFITGSFSTGRTLMTPRGQMVERALYLRPRHFWTISMINQFVLWKPI